MKIELRPGISYDGVVHSSDEGLLFQPVAVGRRPTSLRFIVLPEAPADGAYEMDRMVAAFFGMPVVAPGRCKGRSCAMVDACMAAPARPVALVTHGNLLSLIARSFDPNLGFEFWRSLTNPDVFELVQMDDSTMVARVG